MKFIAHIRQSDKEIQSVTQHLLEVKSIAEEIGNKIGVKHIAGLAGLLHDLGKFTNAFRDYIKKAVFDPKNAPRRGTVDHSTAGGKLLYKLYHTNITKELLVHAHLAEIVGNAIISHHSYLKDYLDNQLESPYLKRVTAELDEFSLTEELFFEQVMSRREFEKYVTAAANELAQFLKKDKSKSVAQKSMFLTKFIFSALIDADRTNTRLFEEDQNYEPKSLRKPLFQLYYEKLIEKVRSFETQESSGSPINLLRKEMSEQCDAFAAHPSGIYTLSIPTGGGKTLASLRYALKHAQLYRKKKIIYVVPFTTIIEQNAQEVRNIIQDDVNILEHHSNVAIDEDRDTDENHDGIISDREKLKLAKDNWDSPIIFTTMVQFLNVFYAKGSREIRRLHNLSEAVIIFDEVQKVPTSCVSLFNNALNFLKVYGESSIVLCTATQPALDFVEQKLEINQDAEMIQNLPSVIAAFKRVEIIDLGEMFDTNSLSDFIKKKAEAEPQILIVLNTKMVVKKLYEKLRGKNVYHLSTSMCAAHRNDILEKVKEHLRKEEPVICISTQLIEAGVDVSFSCVIRSMAGLDSIAQAAGRCNRHGEKGLKNVYIFEHTEEKLTNLKEIESGKIITKRLLTDLKLDPSNLGGHLLSEQAMKRYFQEFYHGQKLSLDYQVGKETMIDMLMLSKRENHYVDDFEKKNKKSLPLVLTNRYGAAAQYFQVINQPTISVIVPFGQGREIIADLNGSQAIEDIEKLFKRAQHYTVNIFEHEKQILERNKGIDVVFDQQIYVLKDGAYHEEYGVDVENEGELEDLVI